MQDGVYSALFGALSAEHRLSIITNNLANVNTVGFKKDDVTFADVFRSLPTDATPDTRQFLEDNQRYAVATILAKPRVAGETIDLSQGALQHTGNPLDLAIQGEGFFKILTPEGVRYTRAGNFVRDTQGQVVDSHGNPLMTDSGPLTLPPAGAVEVDNRGNVYADSQRLGTIALVNFDNLKDLEKDGHNLFRLKPEATGGETAVRAGEVLNAEGGEMAATINQGYLESTNVDVITEMVRMIEVQRTFEAYNKIMQGSQEIDRRLFGAMGKTI